MSLQSAMSVRFNSAGTQLLALRRRLPPVLYELHSRLPSFQFDNQGYFNSCTMKSCCFAGDRDQVSRPGSFSRCWRSARRPPPPETSRRTSRCSSSDMTSARSHVYYASMILEGLRNEPPRRGRRQFIESVSQWARLGSAQNRARRGFGGVGG